MLWTGEKIGYGNSHWESKNINNGGEDKIYNGMMCDTYKANILRTCIVPVDRVVNVQIIEELSLMKNGVLNRELSKSEVDELLQNICYK